MPIVLKHSYFVDQAILDRFKPRILKKIQKASLQRTLLRWHREILPGHFKRRAYDKYRASYGKKKKKGRPMVISGNLQRNVMSNPNVSGTAKKATMRVRFGRPPGLTPGQISSRTFAKMKKHSIKFKQAERRVYAEQASYAKNRVQFELQINAFTKKDIELMGEWMAEDIEAAFKVTGNLKKVKRV